MKKAAIYCRLSREDVDKLNKGDDSESIQNQKLLLIDYASKHDMQIYRIYSDDDYSGADKDRPEWNRMLKDAEKGEFGIIICKSQSRFTREMEMVEKYIHGSFVEWGIRFIGVVDNVDTNIKGNKKSRQINGLVNEWYLEDLSENIKSVFKKKMEDGQFLGAFAPYGYKKDPNNRHKIIVDEDTAKIVREIFDLYIEGYSIKRICYILTESQIPTPTEYKQSKGYNYKNPNSNSATSKLGVWGLTTVRNILTNNTYIGVLTQGKEKKLSYKSKKVVKAPENEWVVLENNHEAIIDMNTFYQVKKMLESKRTVSCDIKGNTNHKAHCLAGKVKCPDCGSSLIKTGGGSSQGSRYLRCQLANKTRNKNCTPHAIRLNQLIDTVASEIRKLIIEVLNQDNEKFIVKRLGSILDNNDTFEAKTKELNSINRIINDNKDALASLYMDKVKKIITESEYTTLKETFNSTTSEQEDKYMKVKNEIESLKSIRTEKRDALTLVKKHASFEELTGEIIAYFIDYIEVDENDMYGNQEIHIHWNI
ncbi:MAG TPA: recombinase family protein [Mobilitalea sp.]|nr:recombinase family protein [Mobilitalea sp.]